MHKFHHLIMPPLDFWWISKFVGYTTLHEAYPPRAQPIIPSLRVNFSFAHEPSHEASPAISMLDPRSITVGSNSLLHRPTRVLLLFYFDNQPLYIFNCQNQIPQKKPTAFFGQQRKSFFLFIVYFLICRFLFFVFSCIVLEKSDLFSFFDPQ